MLLTLKKKKNEKKKIYFSLMATLSVAVMNVEYHACIHQLVIAMLDAVDIKEREKWGKIFISA